MVSSLIGSFLSNALSDVWAVAGAVVFIMLSLFGFYNAVRTVRKSSSPSGLCMTESASRYHSRGSRRYNYGFGRGNYRASRRRSFRGY